MHVFNVPSKAAPGKSQGFTEEEKEEKEKED